MVAGTRDDAEALREEAAAGARPDGLRLSEEKTLITHIDEGLDFLGWRIQRHRKRGTDRRYVYTYPSKKALRAVMAKVKALCRQVDTNHPLARPAAPAQSGAAGWTAFFRPGVSSATFQYLAPTLAPGDRLDAPKTPPGSPGRSSAAATATADGGPEARRRELFNPGWYARPGTATGDQ